MQLKLHHLTVRLIKEGLSVETALSMKATSLDRYDLCNGTSGKLYVAKQFPKPPRWLDFVKNYSSSSIDLEMKNAKAVMFVEAGGRLFAFTFGQGHYLLSSESYESDFGLKVTLNAVDPDKLRSVDARTIDERTINTRRQTSKLTPFESFGFDAWRDLLRAATGEPVDQNLAERLTGADGLSFCAKFDYNEITDKCQQLLNEYGKETYKKRFSCFDHLRIVKDKVMVVTLNKIMLDAIQNKNVENLFLSPPNIFDWQHCNGFRFSKGSGNYVKELKIEDFWGLFKDSKVISFKDLQDVDVIMDDNGFDQRWPVCKCVVYETKYNGNLYVVIEGMWFKISSDFCKEVDEEMGRIPESAVVLPSAKSGEREDDYNIRAAAENKDLILMDKKIVNYGGGHSALEVCDLLGKNEFIHVKKRTSSATMSHLLSQGKMSAITFLNSNTFRNSVRFIVKKENEDLSKCIPNDRPDPHQYNIVYAIITGVTEKDWRFQIPFFSRLNIVESWKELTDLGYNVLIKKIEKVG